MEAFGEDLERTRARGPFELPGFEVGDQLLTGPVAHEGLRAAVLAAGGQPSGEPAPDVVAALERFGRMAGVEVEEVCGLPGPRAQAELWRLAAEWRVKPVKVLTGTLWELP